MAACAQGGSWRRLLLPRLVADPMDRRVKSRRKTEQGFQAQRGAHLRMRSRFSASYTARAPQAAMKSIPLDSASPSFASSTSRSSRPGASLRRHPQFAPVGGLSAVSAVPFLHVAAHYRGDVRQGRQVAACAYGALSGTMGVMPALAYR